MAPHDGLVARLKRGETEAQRELWVGYHPMVLAGWRRILRAEAAGDAEDVAAGVLVDFLGSACHRLRIDDPRVVTSYLKLMASRRSLRCAERRRRFEVFRAEQTAAEGGADPDEMGSRALLLRRLGDCLGHLSPKARQAIRLRYGGGLVNQRIGELLGVSKQYVGRLLAGSRARLRDCLEHGVGATASVARPGGAP